MFTEPRLSVYLYALVPTIIIATPPRPPHNMANTDGKENIAEGLIANPKPKAGISSPAKSSRKARSKSIGPGGLGELETPALKESNGNRRKSAFPAVKSILSSNDDDEKKRRDARRKSLGTLRGVHNNDSNRTLLTHNSAATRLLCSRSNIAYLGRSRISTRCDQLFSILGCNAQSFGRCPSLNARIACANLRPF
jgi:hypothetical protein